MLISLYLALRTQSVVTYALSNVLFHLQIFPMVYSAWDFTYYNDHTRPRDSSERYEMCYMVFFINIIFSVPFFVIKVILLTMYIPYISSDIILSPFTPIIFLIIWTLISLPFLFKYQVIFGLFYWIICCFVTNFPLFYIPWILVSKEISILCSDT